MGAALPLGSRPTRGVHTLDLVLSRPVNRLTFYTDEAMLLHSNGPHHPERADRVRRVVARLQRANLARTQWKDAREATREELLRAHTSEYVDWWLAQRGERGEVDADTAYNAHSVHASLLAAGAAIDATTDVLLKNTQSAWALTRPPGHHAESHRAMGFCFINHAAVAARHAMEVHGLQRVMIIDWDVHHGNGTEEIFVNDPRVLYFSTHQAPLFPHTGAARDQGEGEGAGYTVNLPLPGGITGGDLRYLYRAFIPSLMAAYAPELIIVSAGFDAHKNDPLADFYLDHRDFAALTRIIQEAADVVCDGRTVFLLEGGYDVQALSDSVLACAQELVGETLTSTAGSGPMGERVLRAARALHIDHWPIPEDA